MAIQLYVDLDNTLTDFDSAVKAIGAEAGVMEGATPEDRDRMYKAINQAGEKFWASMSWSSDGKELWKFLAPYHPILLSSPGEFRDAEPGKQTWVNREVPGTTLILDADKFRYAVRGAILVDDMKENIEAWEISGGIGILHTDFESTKQKFLDLLKSPKVMITLANYLRKLSSRLV